MPEKKEYEKPVLENCGPVYKLTLGMNGSNADPGQQNQTKRGAG